GVVDGEAAQQTAATGPATVAVGFGCECAKGEYASTRHRAEVGPGVTPALLVIQRLEQELVDQRGPKRGLGVVGGPGVAAFDVLVVLHGLAGRLKRRCHLARVPWMHPVVTGG